MPQYTTKQDFPTILFSHPTLSTVEHSSGIFFLIRVHNYTRIKGLDSGKITSLPDWEMKVLPLPCKWLDLRVARMTTSVLNTWHSNKVHFLLDTQIKCIAKQPKPDQLNASFQSSPKVNRILITRLICIQWKSSTWYGFRRGTQRQFSGKYLFGRRFEI